jgi:hypothetical protein
MATKGQAGSEKLFIIVSYGIQELMISIRMGTKDGLNLTNHCLVSSVELANPHLN